MGMEAQIYASMAVGVYATGSTVQAVICVPLLLRPSAASSLCCFIPLLLHPSAASSLCCFIPLLLRPSAASSLCCFVPLLLRPSAASSLCCAQSCCLSHVPTLPYHLPLQAGRPQGH